MTMMQSRRWKVVGLDDCAQQQMRERDLCLSTKAPLRLNTAMGAASITRELTMDLQREMYL